MIRPILAGFAVAIGITAAMAQTNPIAERQAIMKKVGGATRVGTQMAKGEVPFDVAKAKEVFATYEAAGNHFYTLFPENSKTGGDTAALPKIWEDMADFKAHSLKLAADAAKASASVTDLDSLKAAMTDVTKNCGACHQTYRAKKS
jgi:cytochrome c556